MKTTPDAHEATQVIAPVADADATLLRRDPPVDADATQLRDTSSSIATDATTRVNVNTPIPTDTDATQLAESIAAAEDATLIAPSEEATQLTRPTPDHGSAPSHLDDATQARPSLDEATQLHTSSQSDATVIAETSATQAHSGPTVEATVMAPKGAEKTSGDSRTKAMGAHELDFTVAATPTAPPSIWKRRAGAVLVGSVGGLVAFLVVATVLLMLGM